MMNNKPTDISNIIKELTAFLNHPEKLNELLEHVKHVESFLDKFQSINDLTFLIEFFAKKMYVFKDYLSVEEAASYLNVSKSQIYKMSSNHEITCYKPNGKNVFFSKQDLEQWIRDGKVASAEDIAKEAEAYAEKFMNTPIRDKLMV